MKWTSSIGEIALRRSFRQLQSENSKRNKDRYDSFKIAVKSKESPVRDAQLIESVIKVPRRIDVPLNEAVQ